MSVAARDRDDTRGRGSILTHALRAAASRAALGLALAALFTSGIPARVHAAAQTITVNTTADEADTETSDGVCHTASGTCSLRAAIQTANWDAFADTIIVPAGTYTLTIAATPNDYQAFNGNLDIREDVDIEGAGIGKTVIQASSTGAATGVENVFNVGWDASAVSISGMTIRYGKAFQGAAIYMSTGTLALSKVSLTANLVTSSGGSVVEKGPGLLTITDSMLSANDGRVLSTNGAAVTVLRTTIAGNVLGAAEGLLRVDGAGGSLLVDRSTISGNSALFGAALALNDGNNVVTATFRNSTISGNVATGSDGAVIATSAKAKVVFENTTVASNTGRVAWPWTADQVTTKNSIFANNSPRNCEVAMISLGHNIDKDGTCGLKGEGDLKIAPQLGSLASNGGPTQTMALASNSPAIDAGAGCPAVDQRGQSRPKDGDGDGVAACDIGAFEAKAVAVVATPTPEPTIVPTEAPTEAPTAAPTDASTPEPTAAPTEAPTPEPTAAPTEAPTTPTGGDGGGGMLPILAILAVVVLAVVGFALSRRRGRGAPGSSGTGG
jgi:CSLREA domain-containing protein